MPHSLRIAVIGAGSTYTPELINGFLRCQDRLHIDTFAFCDTDMERCEVLAALTERMLRKASAKARVERYCDYRKAVRDADYVVTQIRVGKMPARILDERIPLQHGLIGQETTGLGGLSCALRTIPVIDEIADAVQKYASPNAWLINFANPSGLVTEALLHARPNLRCIGLCNIPVKLAREAETLLGEAVECEFTGLNHLCWITGIYDGQTELLERVLSLPIEQSGLNNIPDMKYTPEELRAIGGFPCGYLNYYYHRNEMLAACQDERKTRGEVCLALERELLALYADPATDTAPALLEKRGGAMYSTAAVRLIEALENDTGAMHVVNVQNRGMLPMLLVIGVVCGLVMLQPNMSMAVIMGMLGYALLFVGGCDGKQMIFLLIAAIGAFVLLAVIEPYRMARLTSFTDPWKDPLGTGYQLIQSFYAIGSGGLFGWLKKLFG